jgi:hypothetical protein
VDLLEERTRELEKRINTAEVILNRLEADRMKGAGKAVESPWKKNSTATYHGQRGGGNRCRASKISWCSASSGWCWQHWPPWLCPLRADGAPTPEKQW